MADIEASMMFVLLNKPPNFPKKLCPPSRICAAIAFLEVPSALISVSISASFAVIISIDLIWLMSSMLMAFLLAREPISEIEILPSEKSCMTVASLTACVSRSCFLFRTFCDATFAVIFPSMIFCACLEAYNFKELIRAASNCFVRASSLNPKEPTNPFRILLPPKNAPNDISMGVILSRVRTNCVAMSMPYMNMLPTADFPSASFPSMMSHASMSLFHFPRSVSERTNCML